MTKQQAENYMRLIERMEHNGFTKPETDSLLKIERTLHRWAELECGNENGHIERDEKTGKPLFYNARSRYAQANDPRAYSIIPDREKGALKRLAKLMELHPDYVAYHQSDPRGCAVYIVSKSVLNDGPIESLYTRGIAICY